MFVYSKISITFAPETTSNTYENENNQQQQG